VALTSTNAVKCWGNNGSGQLGDNTTTTRLVPVDVSGFAGDVRAVALGRIILASLWRRVV